MAKREYRIRIVKDLEFYESRGYINNPCGYKVTAEEHSGVFIKEYGYLILHSDYETVEEGIK